MADLATLQTRLAEAETAAHDLALGKKVVELRRGDRMIRYTAANAGSLSSYIDTLKVEIADLEAVAAGLCKPSTRRPIGARW